MSKQKITVALSQPDRNYEEFFENVWAVDLARMHVYPVPDLFILTGGSDVDPSYYGEANKGSHYTNPSRDADEAEMFSFYAGKTHILGICRGMQFMNAMLGGTLHQDMYSIGKQHPAVHRLKHMRENRFSWMNACNSLHHQALKRIGNAIPNRPGIVTSVEPLTGIPEIVEWGDDMLGVQFHPEMFNTQLGDRFFSVISEWVDEKETK